MSRIDDNEELRNRRSSITEREDKQVKRQVDQFTDVHSLADNPEMRKRREAYLRTKIMDSDRSSQVTLKLPASSHT